MELLKISYILLLNKFINAQPAIPAHKTHLPADPVVRQQLIDRLRGFLTHIRAEALRVCPHMHVKLCLYVCHIRFAEPSEKPVWLHQHTISKLIIDIYACVRKWGLPALGSCYCQLTCLLANATRLLAYLLLAVIIFAFFTATTLAFSKRTTSSSTS